jgi:hypothetical protein
VSDLSPAEHDDLVRLAGLLDHAAEPLPATVLPPEPRLRTALDAVLARRGRTIIAVPHEGDVGQITTTVADDVADLLAAVGIGVLEPTERAVLALVLLHTVVAASPAPAYWSDAARVPIAQLKASAVPDRHVTDALARLRLRGLVDVSPSAGVKPGPALNRLTARARSRVERDLVELVAGDDPMLRPILDRLDADDPRQRPGEPVPSTPAAPPSTDGKDVP